MADADSDVKRGTKKVPVTILTGFLGSGKTTLLNHILHEPSHGMKFAIIENEFGAVGIDNDLVTMKQDVEDEEIVEMMNGCICCNVRGDLIPILKRILARKETFDAILIETTGLADPGPVVQTFFMEPEVAEQCELDGVITVVDAKHIVQHLEEQKPDDAINEASEQLAFADRILLNKTDLVAKDELKDIYSAMKVVNSSAEIIETQYSKVEPKKLIVEYDEDDHCDDPDCDLDHHHSHHDHDHKHDHDHDKHDHKHDHDHDKHDHHKHHDKNKDNTEAKKHRKRPLHDNRVSSISFKFEGDVVVKELQRLMKALVQEKGPDLYRYKGIISVAGMEQKFVFQGVHMVFTAEFMENWREGEKRVSKLVFIGKDLNKENITAAFDACKAKPLRFAIGDKVEANVGRFVKGTVVSTWEDGNPYRVRLDGKESEVYAPRDDDRYIRTPRD